MDADILDMYKELEEKVKTHNPSLDTDRLYKAFQFAYECHTGQFRKDGSRYIAHPLAAAQIAADMGLDEDAILSALLHDCIEDTSASYDDIKKLFGPVVADLVEGVTKLTRVHYTTKEEQQMENLRKMLMAMAKDIRVILIKIADRMHNMRTMDYQTPEKQREKALETMEVYAPIAHRLGMQKVKWELEDRALMYIDPEAYNNISETLSKGDADHSEFINSMKSQISKKLKEYGLEATVYGRLKHIYSIYRKMYQQNKNIGEVFDLYALRVIVDTIPECYTALGCIHDLFRPVPGRFKDYIGTPKPNMYQSLHTTVLGYSGNHITPFEVQIRTWEMHHTAEYGVAAHWKYKEGINTSTGDEEKYAWVRRLLETQQDSDAQGFFSELKIDMFADEVFVFTPKGDVVNLPAGATPIDFAYNIHSAVGNSMTGCRINGRIVTFDHILQNGDIIEIITSSSSRGPSRDWLNIAKSTQAKTKIRQWFKKERRDENIAHGKASFEAEMKRANIPLTVMNDDGLSSQVLKKASFPTTNDMYAAIGFGGYTAVRAVNRIREELQTLKAKKAKDEASFLANVPETPEKQIITSVNGIIVEGLDNFLVKFSKCCTPVPGDEIIGFITRGSGVSIHRTDCPNYLNVPDDKQSQDRWVSVEWAPETNDTYRASLTLSAKDRPSLLMDIATAINTIKINVHSMSIRTNTDGTVVNVIVVDVKNLEQLQLLMSRLSNVRGITSVSRSNG